MGGAALGGFAEGEGCEVRAAVDEGAEEVVHGSRGREVGGWVVVEVGETVPRGGGEVVVWLAWGDGVVEKVGGGACTGSLDIIPGEVGDFRRVGGED